PLAYAQYYIDSFLDDMRALNVRRADHMPKVSEHIPEITALIARLVDRGYAYSVDGEVYFRTRKAKHSFGILSHQRFEDIVVEWPRTWMHNGFVTLEREKMSKSLGNFVTIREVLRDYPGEVVRLCLLKAPYREDVEYDAECFARTRKEYDAMRAAIESARTAAGPGTAGKVAALVVRTRGGFFRAMDDDSNR